MVLHLLERGISLERIEFVYMDTGWEYKGTHEYLKYLEDFLGKEIIRLQYPADVPEQHANFIYKIEQELGFISPFLRLCIRWGKFPTYRMPFCTKYLKLKPFKKFVSTIEDEYISCVGIRAEESKRRSKYPEWEWSDNFDCYVWRPILHFTEEDVIKIHKRHNLIPNRLYLNNVSRVGCWPCIYSTKGNLRELDPERVEIIKKVESYLGGDGEKNTFFHKKGIGQVSIDKMMEWAKTRRGGKQLQLFDIEPPTCEKWGLCEFK